MKRNYNTRIIKAKKSYSSKELAELLGVHVQTVRSWSQNGLEPIDSESHLALFLGSDAQNYLRQAMSKRRVKLGPNELYCFTCRNRTTAKDAKITVQEHTIGKGMSSIKREGTCDQCGKKVVRFGSLQQNELATAVGTRKGLSNSL